MSKLGETDRDTIQAVPFDGANTVLSAPKEFDSDRFGHCGELPILRDGDFYQYSIWQPTFRQRLAILFGRNIQLTVLSRGHPPVAMHISKIKGLFQ